MSAFGVDLTVDDVIEKSAAKVAAVGAGIVGASAGVNEGVRRHYNKKGASISVKDQYRHPYRSQYAQGAASLRASAAKKQAKADRTGSERAANSANFRRAMSTHRAGEAQQGSTRYYRSLPTSQRKMGFYRYDKKKRYEAPSGPIGIHKSAFGVALSTADVIAKADQQAPSAGRYAAGTTLGVYHSAAAGKKGQKLKAVGSTIGHSTVGAIAGGAAAAAVTRGRSLGAANAGQIAGGLAGSARAVHSNQAHGRYKPQS